MIPGITSTGSKNPFNLFGTDVGVPVTMLRSGGCRIWDGQGREYVDYLMALGAVSLGYGHPAVTEAVGRAARDGVVGPLAPELECRVAERLCDRLSGVDSVRFLKSGAEAVLAAVRLARVLTGRSAIVTCGYHGWLDAFSDANGVPASVRHERRSVKFNDVVALHTACAGPTPPAAIVVEPVVDEAPSTEWVEALNALTRSKEVVLVLDEIKTGLRLGRNGAAGRYSFEPDIIVLGKALGNGLPCSAVCGSTEIMDAAQNTWISSTLATEFVSLAAVDAVLDVYESHDVPGHLSLVGGSLYVGLEEIAAYAPRLVRGVRGIPEFCYLEFVDDEMGWEVARRCAEHGLLFKRDAYNFVSLAHTTEIVRESLVCLRAVVEQVAYG